MILDTYLQWVPFQKLEEVLEDKAHESVKLKERQLIWTKELINDPKHCFSQKRIDTNKTNISKIKIQVEKHRHGLIAF